MRLKCDIGGLIYLVGAGAVVALDRLTKLFAVDRLDLGEVYTVVPGFNLALVLNRGAAFGFLADSGGWQRWFFVMVGLAISVLIMVTLLRQGQASKLLKLGLTLILGGALGNIIDRVSQGYVIDFVDLHWQVWHWPAFNVADVGITMGALIVLLDVFGSMRATPGGR
jgi:signal peptidase II